MDKCTLTFTPDANSTYWILASWSHTSDATASQDRSQTRLYSVESAVTFNIGEMRPHELTSPQDYINAFALGTLTFGASPAQRNVKIQYTCYGSVTTRIKDARLLVIKADAADQMAEAAGWSSSSAQTYQTKATLNAQRERRLPDHRRRRDLQRRQRHLLPARLRDRGQLLRLEPERPGDDVGQLSGLPHADADAA